MKKLGIIILTVILSTLSMAQERRGGDHPRPPEPRPPMPRMDLPRCLYQLEDMSRSNMRLQDDLMLCRSDRTNLDRIANLERENERLREEISRMRRGSEAEVYNKVDAVRVCGKIDDNYYSNRCIAAADQYKIPARAIEACLGMSDNYYINSCLNSAGTKRISANVIRACIQSTQDNYYRLACINN